MLRRSFIETGAQLERNLDLGPLEAAQVLHDRIGDAASVSDEAGRT
jgi:hypothetical protein